MNEEMIALAKATLPNEACGFVINGEQFLAGTNIADNPDSEVLWCCDSWIAAEEAGEITALMHSHPDGPCVLSSTDRYFQVKTNLPWYLVVSDEVYYFPNVPHLLGREFSHGAVDCYTLFRDAYLLSGITFPSFERNDDWWNQGENLYLDNLPKYGFEQVTDLQVGDVIMMQIKGDTANHAAIYLGDEIILHHLFDRLSKRDVYGGYWQRHTHSVWRYKQWQSLDFTAIFNDMDASSNSM